MIESFVSEIISLGTEWFLNVGIIFENLLKLLKFYGKVLHPKKVRSKKMYNKCILWMQADDVM